MRFGSLLNSRFENRNGKRRRRAWGTRALSARFRSLDESLAPAAKMPQLRSLALTAAFAALLQKKKRVKILA